MAIDRLAYKLVMDHKDFVDGAISSRKELSLAKQVMESTATPAEKYQKQVDVLGRLLKKGSITQEQYNRAVKQLKKPMDDAGTSTKTMSSVLGRFDPRVIAAGVAVGGLAAATLLVKKAMSEATEAVKTQFAEIDKLAKAADKLGIAVEAFAAFRIAADRAGISQEKLTTSLQRMVRKIGDAQRGMGEATKTFESLGLSAEKLSRLPVEEQFQAIAEAIAGMDTHTKRLSTTVKIFDAEGAELINMLELGADGFAEAQRKADDFGLAISRVDAAAIEAANDAIADIKDLMSGMAATAAVELAPAVIVAVEVLQDFAKQEDGVSRVHDLFVGIGAAIEVAADITDTWLNRLERLGELLRPLTKDASLGDIAANYARIFFAAPGPNAAGDDREVSTFVEQYGKRMDEVRKQIADDLASKQAARAAADAKARDAALSRAGIDPGFDPGDVPIISVTPDPDVMELPEGTPHDMLDKLLFGDEPTAGASDKLAKVLETPLVDAIAQGSQKDIELRASLMRPGAARDTGEETVGLLGEAVAELRAIREKETGVIVTEITELPA